MKRKILIAVLMLLFLIPIGAVSTLASTAPTTLKIHYFRYDDNYEGWNLWLWPEAGKLDTWFQFDKDGLGNLVKEEDWGVVYTLDLTKNNLAGKRIGILIVKGTWGERDVSKDRFMEVSAEPINGILHAYFVEGDERVGYSKTDPNGPDTSHKIKSAFFSKENEINFNATKVLNSSEIKVKENGTEISSTTTVSNKTGTIKLNKNLDYGKTYTIVANIEGVDKTYPITFDGIYDSAGFVTAFGYDGNDLGAVVKDNKTSFKLWAPISSSVKLNIYDTGTPAVYTGGSNSKTTYNMERSEKGTWKYVSNENLHGKYYTYTVTNGTSSNEVIDPYAKSAGVNGIRGMVVDFTKVNPEGFKYNTRPNNITNATDAIIYELQVRDLSIHESWNGPDEYRGKFLGLTVEGTKYNGVTTGLDHIKELGVTHVQLLPFFDFGVVDETKLNDKNYNSFNWGYMPLNFNVPEGSFSTDPYDGAKRIIELKQVVNSFTKNNIGLIMDVVYNHTGPSGDSNFNLIIPGYYHRMNDNGDFSNGSGTGNETASERYMMRKFMVDSTVFWATEYNLSGYRFDLMALHDVETMNQITTALKAIDKNILIYGEPWNGGETPLDTTKAADKVNLKDMPNVGAFNDELRDAIKGSVFTASEGGYIQGATNEAILNKLKYGIAGGIDYPGLNLDSISYKKVWHTEPTKTINYVSAHDNNTLWDKLKLSTSFAQRNLVTAMHKQANAIVLTSQGVPFLHAGVEFMRTKPKYEGGYDENSYESPDFTNQLRWDLKAKEENMKVFEYYKDLIALRKNHPAFRMATSDEVIDNLSFIDQGSDKVLMYRLSNHANNDTWGNILVVHNSGVFTKITLPTLEEGSWNLIGDSKTIGEETIKSYEGGQKITIYESETYILYNGYRAPVKEKAKGCFGTISGLFTIGNISIVGISTAIFCIVRRKKLGS